MSVSRDDYLMWGAKVDPDKVSEIYDDLEAEMDMCGEGRFDLVYDGMSGEYAVAGVVLAVAAEHEGIAFHEISSDATAWRPEVVAAVRSVFPEVHEFSLFLFSHYH